jgi:hypothetical protein
MLRLNFHLSDGRLESFLKLWRERNLLSLPLSSASTFDLRLPDLVMRISMVCKRTFSAVPLILVRLSHFLANRRLK